MAIPTLEEFLSPPIETLERALEIRSLRDVDIGEVPDPALGNDG
jgi:hypothetical protein